MSSNDSYDDSGDPREPREPHHEPGAGRDEGHRDDPDWEAGAEARRRARARARARRRGERRRYRDRKERVLHTRISEQLSEDIRRLAEDLRVPTSNLVRNVLEEVFTVVENVSDDVGELFEEVLEEAEGARERIRRHRRHQHRRHRQHAGDRGRGGRSWSEVAEEEIRRDEQAETPPPRERPAFPEVIGWQPLVLNHAQDCADCGRSLPRGSRAFVGLTESGLSRSTLCRTCIQER